jgi:CRISPR/Cas system-associated exonuclease Cas4 (RecB family)
MEPDPLEPELVFRPPLAATRPSNMRRRYLCPGSARLEAGLPDQDSVDASEGRLLHKYWANPEYDRAFLSPQQRDIIRTADDLVEQVLARLSITNATHTVDREITISTPKLPGTPDLVYHWPEQNTALVTDLKSGFANIEGADQNLQLRAYAVLVAWNYDPIETVFAAILSPRKPPRERITLANYSRPDLDRAATQIETIIKATEQPDAPLRAGEEQCRYCRAKVICPEFRKAATTSLLALNPDKELSKTAREAYLTRKIKECSDDQLEQLIKACKLVEFADTAANDEARERIQAGKYGRFYLGKESEVRVIKDVGRAIGLLHMAKVIDRADALKLCSISLREIESAYRERNDATWNEARDKIDKVLKSVISIETRKARILPKK